MGKGFLHGSKGGGAGLNLKVVGGTSRPGGGDTLTWDGNTEGREIAGEFVKVSDVVLTKADLANGATMTLDDGYIETYSSAEMAWLGDGMCIVGEMAISIPYDNFDAGDGLVLSAGIYFVDTRLDGGSVYVASLTIPGYTGFGGGSVKDNTIWVNTDTAINGYVFAAEAPENPVEGMVWIKTATESTTPLNVDKKNAVILYPQTAQQYIGGAWVGKTAQVYTSGAWHELWDGYYYKLGETYEAITGGYETTVSDNTSGTNNGLLTFNSNNMVLSPVSVSKQGGNLAYSVKAIDVTDVNTLVFDCFADSTDSCGVGVATQKGVWGGAVASKSVTNTTRANVSVDVSSVTGEVYILLKAWYNPSTSKGKLTVYNIHKQ